MPLVCWGFDSAHDGKSELLFDHMAQLEEQYQRLQALDAHDRQASEHRYGLGECTLYGLLCSVLYCQE